LLESFLLFSHSYKVDGEHSINLEIALLLIPTRVKNNRRYKLVKTLEFRSGSNDKNLQIQSDEIVNLYRGKKVISCNLRLVKAINDKGEEFSFLTNLFDSVASEIADIYKKRWDIAKSFLNL
jgi:hypothetical protein